MVTSVIQCAVVETPEKIGALEQQDLLPWSDPYITSLMRRLEEEFPGHAHAEARPPLSRSGNDDSLRFSERFRTGSR